MHRSTYRRRTPAMSPCRAACRRRRRPSAGRAEVMSILLSARRARASMKRGEKPVKLAGDRYMRRYQDGSSSAEMSLFDERIFCKASCGTVCIAKRNADVFCSCGVVVDVVHDGRCRVALSARPACSAKAAPRVVHRARRRTSTWHGISCSGDGKSVLPAHRKAPLPESLRCLLLAWPTPSSSRGVVTRAHHRKLAGSDGGDPSLRLYAPAQAATPRAGMARRGLGAAIGCGSASPTTIVQRLRVLIIRLK